MPVVVEPDSQRLPELLKPLPSGCHSSPTLPAMQEWLARHHDEYAIVLGPSLDLGEVLTAAAHLRMTRPAASVILVRDIVDTTVLTQAMHAGIREVVADHDPDALGTAVSRAQDFYGALKASGGDTPHKGKVITVFSPKGGVGKTTASVNLALTLGAGGTRSVCLVDMDLAFGDVAITLQLFPNHTLEHAIGSEENLDFALIEPMLTRHDSGVMVLAAPSLPDVQDRVKSRLVTRTLQVLRETFEYVVVDTAPAFDELTLTALDETDDCIIVATLDVPTLKNVKVALDTLDVLNVAEGHRYLLLNRADDAVGLSGDKVEAILGMTIAASVSTSIDIAAATNAGSPIAVASPDHVASRSFIALAQTITGEEETGAAEAAGDDARRRFKFRK